jgi:outer membrane murein-binding lipoprotein Lpp
MNSENKESKFSGMLKNRKKTKAASTVEDLQSKEAAIKEDISTDNNQKKVGRPKGKRSNPNYTQISTFINKENYESAKIRLIKEGKKRDFGDLVDELLEQWLSD